MVVVVVVVVVVVIVAVFDVAAAVDVWFAPSFFTCLARFTESIPGLRISDFFNRLLGTVPPRFICSRIQYRTATLWHMLGTDPLRFA